MKNYSKLGLFKSRVEYFMKHPQNIDLHFKEIEIELYIALRLED